MNQRRITVNDVCREVGLSKATISRVVNNMPGVSETTRKMVLAAMKKLNYTPLATARDLSRSKRNTIGVIFQDLTAGFLLNVFRGVMNVATRANYNVMTTISTAAGDEFELPRKLLAEGRIDGLIWLDPRLSKETIDTIKYQGIPIVLIQKSIDEPDINSVSIENTHGAYVAASHLLNLGYRRLLLVTGPQVNTDSHQRLQGVRQALQEKGLELSPSQMICGEHVGIHAIKALKRYLETGNPMPEAIFCFNDDMAIAIQHWLKNQGIKVPQDVAIMGFDGVEDAEYVGLTTVATPMFEAGVMAAQNLLDILSDTTGDRKPRQIMLKGTLCIRESCGARLRGKTATAEPAALSLPS